MHPRGLSRFVKWLFWLSTCSFLVVQLQVFIRSAADSEGGATEGGGRTAPHVSAEDGPASSDALLRAFASDRGLPARLRLRNHSLPVHNLTAAANFSLEDMRRLLLEDNARSVVQNDAAFGPPLSPENAGLLIQFVIVIQVHNRTRYLEKLIDSLGGAAGISNTLLVFSHDFYSPEINRLIKRIRFCRVIQIFYPHSIQLSPNRFPGPDPNDCPATLDKAKAKEMRCNNWEHPDKYGHYRLAKLTQIKHHWWWKTNYVFDGIRQLRNFTGYFLFLEEDHYVSPDFLHVLAHIAKHKDRLCEQCRVITLGYYLKSYASYGANINKLAVYPWFSSRHNMGMAINRDTWLKIKDCSELFCKYDDYNWDWSLLHINLKCMKPGPMHVIFAKAPRVFHIGDCGVHQKGKACEADKSLGAVLATLAGARDGLFPEEMSVAERSKRTLKPPKENGGWGDSRDIRLCLNHTVRT